MPQALSLSFEASAHVHTERTSGLVTTCVYNYLLCATGFLIQLTAVGTPLLAALAGQIIPKRTVIAAIAAFGGSVLIGLDDSPAPFANAELGEVYMYVLCMLVCYCMHVIVCVSVCLCACVCVRVCVCVCV